MSAMSAPVFTIAVPCHNGEKKLPHLLDRLYEQDGLDEIPLEVVVVNNNSTDGTAEVIESYRQRDDLPYTLTTYFEDGGQGAAFARLRAMKEATTEWVGFLDDDIVPDRDWLKSAYRFGQDKPRIAVFGGEIRPDYYEKQPPKGFKKIKSLLAIRDELGDCPVQYNPSLLFAPPSASWVVRRQAWRDCVPDTPSLAGRSENIKLQGDDYEPLIYMHRQGWEVWYNPEMRVVHRIPARRLTDEKLLEITQMSSLCVYPLRTIAESSRNKPSIFARIVLGNLKRASKQVWENRSRAAAEIDPIVRRCQLKQHLDSAWSPFHYYFCKFGLLK
ncbi:MAG: hormogonium polysaccharide biosynthesis glycosyltransferase HpsE [Geitlerinemataceae cyanobacterium]